MTLNVHFSPGYIFFYRMCFTEKFNSICYVLKLIRSASHNEKRRVDILDFYAAINSSWRKCERLLKSQFLPIAKACEWQRELRQQIIVNLKIFYWYGCQIQTFFSISISNPLKRFWILYFYHPLIYEEIIFFRYSIFNL